MNNPSTKTQVVIVGAGPSGLSMAVQLLRYDIDFIIIEKNETTTPLSKAVVVQARTLEIFDEIGLAKEAVSEGQITTGLNLFHNGKRRAGVNLSRLGEGLSPFPYALSLEQSETEKLLAEHLYAHGKSISWRCEFLRFEQRDTGVVAYYKDPDGTECVIEADYLVGCDGAHSLVRHQIGQSFEGDTVPKIFYVADVTLSSPVICIDELFIFLIRKGFILFFPMQGDGHYRIVGILPGAGPNAAFTFDDIKDDIVTQVGVPLAFNELRWFSSYKVHSRKAGSFMDRRCFIAGDAAHIHTPAGGQGMNTGIQDSYNLAWKLAGVIRGTLVPDVLDTYDTERTQNAAHLLQTTDRMFDVMAGTNPLMNFFRLHIFPTLIGWISNSAFAKKKMFPLISQTGIGYPDSALTLSSRIGKVKAGDRMPYIAFADGTQVFDFLRDPGFKLLFFGDENRAQPVLKTNVSFAFRAFAEIPKPLFGNEMNFYIALRPDNHILYIGNDTSACINAFSRFAADATRQTD